MGLSFGPLTFSEEQQDEVNDTTPAAATPLQDKAPSATREFAEKFGAQGGLGDQDGGFGGFLDRYKSFQPEEKRRPGPVPRVGSAFQQAFSQTGQALGATPDYGGGFQQQPQAPFGAALQRFKMSNGY